MKASSLTLTLALGLIPKVTRQRYSDTLFGIPKANAILQDIEKKVDAEYYKEEKGLILVDEVQDYVLPDDVRLVRGVYEVPAGKLVPDKSNNIPFEMVGHNRLRLSRAPVVSDTSDDFSGTATGNAGDNFSLYDTVELVAPLEENSLKSALVVINLLLTNQISHRIIKSNDPVNNKLEISGEFPVATREFDTYNVYHNYFLMDVMRYITRVSDVADTIDIPQDWEELFVAGLRYYYEKQTDMESSQYRIASEEYGRLLREMASDEKRKVGTHPSQVPRAIPDFNNHTDDRSYNRYYPHQN